MKKPKTAAYHVAGSAPGYPHEPRDIFLGAFYQALNEDAMFAASLAELHRRFPDARWQDAAVPPDAALVAFIIDRPWLPRGVVHDLRASLDAASAQRAAPQLRVHRLTAVVGAPATRAAIAYDPLAESADAFMARAALHIAAMNGAMKSAGWKPLHPKLRSGPVLRREALRLYRHAVLKWTWDAIADEEGQEVGAFVAPETVRTSVRRWARILGMKKLGDTSLLHRMHRTYQPGPMPLACLLCRTRNLAPDAQYFAASMDSNPTPVVVICESCVLRLGDFVKARRAGTPIPAEVRKKRAGR